MSKLKIDEIDFAKSLGIESDLLSESCVNLIKSLNFDLEELKKNERDQLILQIIKKIKEDIQVIASPDRTSVWESGWGENLSSYIESNRSLESLIPKFIRSGQPIRWFQDFYIPVNPNFELNFIKVLRHFISDTYLTDDIVNLYEFGAGTGHNLVHFSKLNPKLNLYGTDFVESSVELMKTVGVDHNHRITAQLFDMLEPNSNDFKIEDNSAVLTFGALEQLGGDLENIISYFVDEKPKICIHVEPIAEFYDENSLVDYLANWFQSKRGYSAGLVNLLNKAEKSGKIEIIKSRRLFFGSLMMEGYNLIVWRTKN